MRHWKGWLALCGLAVLVVIFSWQSAQPQSPIYETRIVVLKAKADLTAVWGNRVAVKRALMEIAERSQRELLPQLDSWRQQGAVRRYQRFWVINAIAVEASSQVFDALAQHPAVAAIRPNFTISLPRPIPSRTRGRALQAFTWGLEKIRVPEAWQNFQVQGENVVAGVIDSGFDASHPDLRGKLRPVNGWLDVVNGLPTPYDDNGHGTHVSGTIGGGNASGTQIGVAPKVTFIAAKFLNAAGVGTFQGALTSMQWVMDPDNDPDTDDGADVVNNSWGHRSDSPDMIPEYRDIINAWVAANIFPAFAIGNSGPSPRTTDSPGDYPMAFGVGATDVNDVIADFSSRGPVFWSGIGDIIKPDVSAPGVDVFSSVPGGGYERWDGTSMATPHVAGTVALMLSLAHKNRVINQVDVDFLKQALEATAVDLGPPGKDNSYGAGRIDAFEALKKIPPPPVTEFPDFSRSTFSVSASETVVGEAVTYSVQVINSGNGDANQLVVTVPDIPTAFASVEPQDGGTFIRTQRQVQWTAPLLRAGQSATFRFRAIVDPNASEQTVTLSASISAQGVPTFITNAVSTRIVSLNDPFEPNDAPAQAHRLVGGDFEMGTPTDGVVMRAYLLPDEQDWFVLDLPANKVFWLEVRAWQTGSTFNPKLQVYDGTGQTLLASNSDYIGGDPIVLLKTGGGGDFLLQVTADDNVPTLNRRGTYRLVVREATPNGALGDFVETALTGDKALKAGESAIVLGVLRNIASQQQKQKLVRFNFPVGLRLIIPSQARFFAPIIGPLNRGPTPTFGDWLLFIADVNEAVLYQRLLPTDLPALPVTPLNLGRIWVQDGGDVLFFRVETLGRSVRTLSDLDLTVDLDTDGNLTNGAEFSLRVRPGELGVFQGATKKADFSFFNLTERGVDLGLRWADIGNAVQLRVAAQITDGTIGVVDRAPDVGWALLSRDDPTRTDDLFGISPAAGTLVSNSGLTVWFITDARITRTGSYPHTLTLPAAESTLLADLTQPFEAEILPGPPASLTLILSANQVPSTTRQVTATVTVLDAANNGVGNQRVRLSLIPSELGNFSGAAATEVTTDSNGQGSAVINLTGRVGILTVQAEVIGTTLTASQQLTVQLSAATAIQISTTPPLTIMDTRKIVQVTAGGSVLLRATLLDGGNNPIPSAALTITLIPETGQPQLFNAIDGDTTTAPNKFPDEDGRADGTVTVTLGRDRLGTQTATIDIIVASGNVPPQAFAVEIRPGRVTNLVLVEPTEAELQASVQTPLLRVVGDQLTLKVRVTDEFNNPILAQPINEPDPQKRSPKVFLTVQQGLAVRSEFKPTDQNGEVTFNLPFPTPGTYAFWLMVDGLRQPTNLRQAFRVQVLPKLDPIPSETVRGFGLPFFPPAVQQGQNPPSLSEILGIDPSVLTNRIVRYDPRELAFKFVDPTRPINEVGVDAGVGFFIKPSQSLTVRPQRGRLPDQDFVEVSLPTIGWNLISFPITVPVAWNLNSVQVRVGATTRPLAQAGDAVLPFLWRWDSAISNYRFVYDRNVAQGDFEGTVQPWEAYFAFALQPCTLIVPVPIGARQAATASNRSADWQLFSLKVQQGDRQTNLMLGLGNDGKSVDIALPPSPVVGSRAVLLGEDGKPLGVSVRPRRQRLVWTLALQGTSPHEEAVISGDNLAALPSDWSLVLVNPMTGEQRSLRTGSYRVHLSDDEQRKLLVIAEQKKGLTLRVHNLRATPLRGRSLLLEFTLTSDAQTEIVVQSLTGRMVRVLDGNTHRQAGVHRITWSGVDSSGRPVPPTAYLVRVIARDDKGQIAQGVILVRLR